MKQLVIGAVACTVGIVGAILLWDGFADKPITSALTMTVCLWAALVIAAYLATYYASRADKAENALAVAEGGKRELQDERALSALLDEKIFEIFTICYTPTLDSVPDARYYPDFRKQLLLTNKGRRNLWELLRFKQVPAIPALRGADKLTNEQLERLHAFVQRTQPTPVR